MKNHLSEVQKFLIIAATILITCSLIAFGYLIVDASQDLGNTSTKKLNELNQELSESDITKYDGMEVKGSDVVNFIKKYLGDYNNNETGPFTIKIITSSGTTTHINKQHIEDATNFATSYYIKPTAKFKGLVIKNSNEVIITVQFEQK